LLVFAIGFVYNSTTRGQELPVSGFFSNHICQEIAMEFTELIPEFYNQGEVDSLFVYMYDWDLQCGLAEPLLRMYILNQIATNTFSDDFFPDNIFDYLRDYEDISYFDHPHYYLDYYSWEYEKMHPSFNPFTIELANYLKGYEDLSLTERFFVEFYSNDFEVARKRLNDKELEGTRLGKLYHKRMKKRYKDAYKPYGWIMAGAWLPRGNLALMGNHPQIGGGIGYHKNGFFVDLNLAVAFLKSKNEYEVSYMYQRQKVRGFTNFNISIAVGANFFVDRHPILKLGGAVGYESIMAISPNPEFDEPGKFIHSFFAGPLLELSFPITDKYYIGFYTRYNLLNFENRPGTNLKGNAQWLGVKFGVNLHDKNKIGDYYF